MKIKRQLVIGIIFVLLISIVGCSKDQKEDKWKKFSNSDLECSIPKEWRSSLDEPQTYFYIGEDKARSYLILTTYDEQSEKSAKTKMTAELEALHKSIENVSKKAVTHVKRENIDVNGLSGEQVSYDINNMIMPNSNQKTDATLTYVYFVKNHKTYKLLFTEYEGDEHSGYVSEIIKSINPK